MRLRLAWPLVLRLLMVAGLAGSAAAASPTKRCKDDRRVRCGQVKVPLYRLAPDDGGRRLTVKFRVFPRTDRSKPALEPIVAAEGGPGYSTIDSADSYLFMLGPLRRRHDMVVVDNRGTGRSGAINCPRLQAQKGIYINQGVTGCIEWPAPRYPDPPVPPGAGYPNVPVLVLDGDLDLITPLGDSEQAASLFPNSTYVVFPNVGHVTALADYPVCGAGIVRRFLRSLSTGDTSCIKRTPEIHVVPEFPRRVAAAPAARSAGGADRSRPVDRRAAWSAAWALGDALARWWLISDTEGRGLRGGSFSAIGDYLSYSPVRFKLRRVRFVPGAAVSGTMIWDRRRSRVTARLRVRGVVRGRLRIAWPILKLRAVARMRGRLDGRPVRLRTPAP